MVQQVASKVSVLPEVTVLGQTDFFPVVADGVTSRITQDALKDSILGDLTGLDSTAGEIAFTADADGTELNRVSLTDATYYRISFSGMCLTRTATAGSRMSLFDYKVLVNVTGGVATIESPPQSTAVPPAAQGNVKLSLSGLDLVATLYSSSLDTEWRGNFVIELQGTLADQLPTGWTPASSPNCLAYWDPATGVVVTGSDVSTWSAQIGGVVGTAATNRPTFVASHPGFHGAPAVLFQQSGSQRMVVSNLVHSAADFQFYALLDQNSLDADSYLLDFLTGRTVVSPDRAGGGIAFSDGASFRSAGGAAVTGPQILGWQLSSDGNARIRKNLVEIANGLTYAQKTLGGSTRMGSNNSGASSFLDAYVGGVAIFVGTSAQDRYRTELYFKLKAGL